MPQSLLRLAALAVAAFASPSLAANIPGGSIFVSQSASASNDGAAASIRVFQTNGKSQTTIAIPPGSLQVQGTRGGRLALSPDGKFVGIAGYIPPFSGSGDLLTRSDSNAPRGFVSVRTSNGAISAPTEVGDQDQEAADTVVTDDAQAWLAGGDDLVYWDGQTDVVFDQGTFANTILPKGIRGFDDRLYMVGLRPNFLGFVADFDGFPKGDSDEPRVLFDVANPEDIAVADDGDTIYVARAEGFVDVYVKDKNWSIRNRLNAGSTLRGVAVDFSGSDPVVYAIDTKRLWKVVDRGRNAKFKNIARAEAGSTFLGIALTPGGGAPQIKLASKKTFTTSRTAVTIRGTAADADGLKTVRVKRGRNGTFKAAKSLQDWSYRASLKPGLNTFFVQAVDNAGNESKVLRVQVTLQ